MKHVYLVLFSILSIVFVQAQDKCAPVGWATQNGGVTGGGSATPTVVTTYAALKTALTSTSVKVVHVSGTITFPTNGRITIQDTDGKTIIGLAGSRMISVDKTKDGSGIMYIKRSKNFIMRNLTFEGPGAYDTDGNDNLTIDACTNFWVDHCDFQDGMDGNFDIKNASDYISVTWCKFSYIKAPIPNGPGGSDDHRYTNLIGSSDGATGDAGKLRVTFQYCWWGQGCVERMPRVRFGKIHLANNLYNSTVSNNVIRAGYKADLLIESNVFIGVNKPIDLFENDFTAVTARNNIFTNTSGNTAGSGTSFTPPYTLTVAPANTVQALVTNTACGSGATLDSPTQCGCGTTPVNNNPTATLSAPANGASGCIGTAITLTASAQDSDGTIQKVDFYNGTALLGSDNTSPYSITYTPTAAGTLSIKATATDNAGGTGTSATNTVTVSALPTASVSSSTTNLCPSGSVVLTATTGASYKWFRGTEQVGTAATYTAAEAGAYTVEVTNAAGCKATSAARTLTGTLQATPTITASATSFCAGGSAVLTASSGASYKWYRGTAPVGTAASLTVTEAGAYTVEVTNASGCKATSAVTQIAVNTATIPTVTASSTSFCAGGSAVLTASSGASYKWYRGTAPVGTAASLTVTEAGAYTVEVTNASGCKATSAVTQIAVNTATIPTVTASSTSFCAGGSAVLTASSGASYKWYRGTAPVGTAASLTVTEAGAYTVEVTNASGCKATSAVTQIGVNTATIPTVTASSTSFCTGGSAVLTASSGASYKWYRGTVPVGTAASLTVTEAGAYTVEVTNASGCKAASSVTQINTTQQTVWYADADNDGKGDAASTLLSCTKPQGYVSVSGDACPADPGKTAAGNCGCGNTEASCLDCSGTPNGTAFYDNCSICVGGNTEKTACVTTATINGTNTNIKVVPQPFDVHTSISIENLGMIQSITIINSAGTVVETTQQINAPYITVGESLASGLYTVLIHVEQGVYTTKIVKK
ncbi:T9SS type A sorting domain-containing protein [Cytophaga hutchinsonii]|uniref:CHU large protein candidate pectate lyase, polysaccharide lyase family 1 protein n=1 Tax=Cytophaga hutchinsonii (strain ATCC 33406 / DSM 1761 / CIP 103989 / NBRC 15051 / NCIMB 9469 / D465) TaxID=269798 RepID=A0A6N4SQ18_CYTH3|nr:Ig-like domain-containing protein [Cytophaga hutchinsonii]ABG58437.1 CHU large protein; candidate pectate lyase, polysaccharide lyase family 1 protein [Cytophaga hutchinsonii ATCC 33406]SFX74461.1 Por secretion system C-terminal sorting domain-containing protein [Cytophaga hutchinsonii ATCC 33406]